MQDDGDGSVAIHHCEEETQKNDSPGTTTEESEMKPPVDFKQLCEDGKHVMQFSEISDDVPFVSVDTPQSFQAFVERMRPLYGAAFHSNEEFELFMRLPLSDSDRYAVFKGLTLAGRGSKRAKPEH